MSLPGPAVRRNKSIRLAICTIAIATLATAESIYGLSSSKLPWGTRPYESNKYIDGDLWESFPILKTSLLRTWSRKRRIGPQKPRLTYSIYYIPEMLDSVPNIVLLDVNGGILGEQAHGYIDTTANCGMDIPIRKRYRYNDRHGDRIYVKEVPTFIHRVTYRLDSSGVSPGSSVLVRINKETVCVDTFPENTFATDLMVFSHYYHPKITKYKKHTEEEIEALREKYSRPISDTGSDGR